MTLFPRMAEHHSGFDQSTLPSIPSDWVDTSWVNDCCPSFEVPGKPVRVWIDYPDPQHREFPEDGRFMVTAMDGDQLSDLTLVDPTDDWSAILEYLNHV